MPVWHFVRHGESTANAARWLAGHVDAPLTERGRSQARARAAEIQALPIARVLTSDLSRAHETARLLVGPRGWPLTRHHALRERHLGAWERVSRDTLDDGAPELMRWDLGPPGGEAPRDVALRWCRHLATVEPIAGHTLLVGHGLALKSVVGLLDGLDEATITARPWGNVHLESREVAEGAWAVLAERLTADRSLP